MIQFTTLEDGSLLYESRLEFANTNYERDPENELRLIPLFRPCTRRRVELRTLECGRKRGKYKCDKFIKQVTIKDCGVCDAAEQ